ncbi:hypothetical protein ACHHV8_09980 [Paenibacillus sp. TAB 01]|uniref:hypothetical protein n=1 Tax=Paenibacillus sp. TAB 01 TaxID=3368988 RepID=UPI003751DE00
MHTIDMKNRNVVLIVSALASMVEDEGKTPREAFQMLEDIKRDTWHALQQIHMEAKGK